MELGSTMSMKGLNYTNPCFSYSLDTEVVENMTLNEMKKYLTADDFLEYCKDRLYPINVVIDGE